VVIRIVRGIPSFIYVHPQPKPGASQSTPENMFKNIF
jgi:hypothetical protein